MLPSFVIEGFWNFKQGWSQMVPISYSSRPHQSDRLRIVKFSCAEWKPLLILPINIMRKYWLHGLKQWSLTFGWRKGKMDAWLLGPRIRCLLVEHMLHRCTYSLCILPMKCRTWLWLNFFRGWMDFSHCVWWIRGMVENGETGIQYFCTSINRGNSAT